MRRFGKILCGFGLMEFVGAVVLLFVFKLVPYPWGWTLPGGLSEVGTDSYSEALDWQMHVLSVLFGIGLIGLVFLLVGGLAYLISRFAS